MATFKETNREIEFRPETMNFWQKIKWCIKLFMGFKTIIKVKEKEKSDES